MLFGLGALLALAAELPFGGWLQIPILSIVWWRLRNETSQTTKQYYAFGLIFGLGYFLIGLWWLYISMHDVGGMNPILSAIAVLLLSLYVALYFSAATFTIRHFKQSQIAGLLLAASWVVAEYLRGYIFTGFPWMGLAENQLDGPFSPIAPVFGGLACTFLVVWASWEILQMRTHPIKRIVMLLATIAVIQFAGKISFTKPLGDPISVRLIQGNFEQRLKFNPQAVGHQIDFYASEIQKESADLIILPETAFELPQSNLPTGLLSYLQNYSDKTFSNLLLGLIGEAFGERGMQYTNRAIGISPHAKLYQYDKNHLVPFGEFIPPGFDWFIKAFNVPLGNFARGGVDQKLFSIERKNQASVNAAITICYEDVFGDELAARIKHNQEPVHLLINMTNLAWFGKSQAPTQQLRLSQLRSLETGLPALRATNTGITAALGPDGKLLQTLPAFTQATLTTKIQPYSGQTPYVRWGNLPILSLSAGLLIWGFIRRRRF